MNRALLNLFEKNNLELKRKEDFFSVIAPVQYIYQLKVQVKRDLFEQFDPKHFKIYFLYICNTVP